MPPSVFLDKGQPANFSGYLLTPERTKELYNNDIDLSLSKKTIDNLNLQIVDYNTRLTNYQTQNLNLSERLQKSETGVFEKVGFFLLGAIVTGGIAIGLGRAL